MKNKKGMSIISLGIMAILILILTVSITMLLITALKGSVKDIEQAPSYMDKIFGD